MKSKEVLEILKVTRQTLCNYVKQGHIKVTKLGNGYYDYDKKSVYNFLNIDLPNDRSNVIYARVSTYKQKNDLDKQVSSVKNYCDKNNIKYSKIYKEIGSGIDFDRKIFQILLNDIINHKVNCIYITFKDRISRLSFLTLQNIFSYFGTTIVPIYDDISNNNELIDELISIIHILSTKQYSNRRKYLNNNIIN
jgi:predicted site-specific integrase-resolvase